MNYVLPVKPLAAIYRPLPVEPLAGTFMPEPGPDAPLPSERLNPPVPLPVEPQVRLGAELLA